MENKETLELLEQLVSKIDKVLALVKIKGHESELTQELDAALAKAQAEMEVAELNKGNPYFKSKYADLMSIVSASRPALTKYGLSVRQKIMKNDDGSMELHTRLAHASGQYTESVVRIVPLKNDPQSLSSQVSYLKRMCYASLVGVVTGDEDDDGEAATHPYREVEDKGTALSTKYNPKFDSPETITKEQREQLEYILEPYPDIVERILKAYGIHSLADMAKSKYQHAFDKIMQIKNAREGIK